MGKMHELLAVEKAIVGNLNRDSEESIHVLKKSSNFLKEAKSKRHFAEDDKKLDEDSQTDIVTTVPDRITWHMGHLDKFLDIQVQKDTTNQKAVADVIIDGQVILTQVPATTLLMMETKLGVDLRKVFEAIPTLDANQPWEFDSMQRLWKAEPPVTFVTKKTMKAVVLAPATDKHPAQVKEVSEDVPVAKITRTVYSGMITSAQKAELLGRLDTLVNAIKTARQRANAVEVASVKDFGEKLTGYLINELKLGA
jgi:hypothetical protein